MSYDIIFQTHVFFEPMSDDLSEDSFIVAIEVGSNNVIDQRNRVARDWSVAMLGSHDEVLERACVVASAIPGGSMRKARGSITSKSYIASIRQALADSRHASNIRTAHWCPNVRVVDSEDTQEQLNSLGLEFGERRVYSDSHHLAVTIPNHRKMEVFDLARRFPERHPSYFVDVYGLPKS